MTLPVIAKVFGWVISTSVSTCEIEVWDEVKRPCSTLCDHFNCTICVFLQFFSCLCSWMFPMIVLKVPWSARGRPNFRQKSQVQYRYLCHPLTIQKTDLPISPCARSQVLLGPNSSFCCLNHLKSQKKNHYIFCYSLAWLSVSSVAPVVRESLRAPRATGFGPRPWDGILGQIETAPPMQVFWHHVFLCEIHCTIINMYGKN